MYEATRNAFSFFSFFLSLFKEKTLLLKRVDCPASREAVYSRIHVDLFEGNRRKIGHAVNTKHQTPK